MNPSELSSDTTQSRRSFLKATSLATTAGVLAPHFASAQEPGSKLKLGLIGCGGRGSGAANQALTADSNVELWAMGDVFESSIERSLNGLTEAKKDQVNVPSDRQFLGLDAVDKVLASGVDVVILTTPPGFRPQHLRKAIEAGKHVFCEKPVAVDAPGVRSVIESARMAQEKKLNIVCGFCWRYEFARREAFGLIHDGAIGDINSVYSTYYTGPVKPMPEASARREGESDVEWHVRNWYNFSWLSGDSLVEQAVHSVDKIAWAMKDIDPIAAVGVGGRQIPAHGGNIFDNFHIVYEYPEAVYCHLGSRQQAGCYSENHDYIKGSKGNCRITWDGPVIRGDVNWRYKGEENDMYQNEHDTLFGHLRSGEYINNGEWMAHSTMLGIMGRMAAYTGQRITWKMAMESEEDLAPDSLEWNGEFTPTELPRPGQTKFS